MLDEKDYLETLEENIRRMNTNSFLVKGGTFFVVFAILSMTLSNKDYVFIAYLPIVVCWAIDGYYYSKEMDFTARYKKAFAADPENVDIIKPIWFTSMLSFTTWPFYACLIVLTSIIHILKIPASCNLMDCTLELRHGHLRSKAHQKAVEYEKDVKVDFIVYKGWEE
jgi:hypothetical protein